MLWDKIKTKKRNEKKPPGAAAAGGEHARAQTNAGEKNYNEKKTKIEEPLKKDKNLEAWINYLHISLR